MSKSILLVSFLLFPFFLHAQKNYAVKVADSKTENPLNNAIVIAKSTKIKASTNESGTTVILASPGDILSVSCIGYVSQEVTLSTHAAVHVLLAKVKKKSKNRS